MQGKLRYQDLYTKLSASLVIWENEVKRADNESESSDDLRTAQSSNFIGQGAKYAHSKQGGSSICFGTMQPFRAPVRPSLMRNAQSTIGPVFVKGDRDRKRDVTKYSVSNAGDTEIIEATARN